MSHLPLRPAHSVEDIDVHEPAKLKLFTRQSLARYLGVHINTVDRIVRRGELPAYRISGRRRFHPDDVDYYIRAHRE